MRDQFDTITVTPQRETAKAVLAVVHETNAPHWIPKSVIRDLGEVPPLEVMGCIDVKKWWLRKAIGVTT